MNKLEPRKCKVRGATRWRVRVGARLTGSRARKRYFASRTAALEFVEQTHKANRKLGQAAFALSFTEQAEAARCFQKLRPSSASLTQAVDFFLEAHPDGKPVPLVEDFSEEFFKARKHSCTKHTLATYRSDLKHVTKEFGQHTLREVFQADVEEWASDLDLAPRTIGNALDTFTTLMGDAVRKGMLLRNPVEFVPRPTVKPSPPGILSVVQSARLLAAARDHRPELLAAVAIALFAGLRRSELCALMGGHLIIEEKLIEVAAHIAKTRQRRLVTIRPNLAPWLQWLPANGGPVTGTNNPDVFGGWLRELAIKAGILDWPHNALRHSFASYLMALLQNETQVAAEMGNSPNIIFRHYRAVVRPAVAQQFFALTPDSLDAVIQAQATGNGATRATNSVPPPPPQTPS